MSCRMQCARCEREITLKEYPQFYTGEMYCYRCYEEVRMDHENIIDE